MRLETVVLSALLARSSVRGYPMGKESRFGLRSSRLSGRKQLHSIVAAARVSISDTFDGGNIKRITASAREGDQEVVLHVKPDVYTELERKSHSQYFCFRATVSSLEMGGTCKVTYVIENASEVSYPTAWRGSTVFFTTHVGNTDSWRRKADTEYRDGVLTWTHLHSGNGSVYFSYFPPYSYARHLDLISRCAERTDVSSLGQTLDGREIECVSVGSGDQVCWIIHRQHPGEPMAEFYAEGLLHRLLGLDSNGEVDGMARKVVGQYKFYVVPCMCPDGAVRGHLRANAVGANLNREWGDSSEGYRAPSLERSPEVYHVLNKMDETGVDCFIDVHGDEELPFNFLSGAEGTNNWGTRLKSLHGAFLAAYTRANCDMQQTISYEPYEDGTAPRNLATNCIANRFNCLSATLEMPFKDCLTNPDPERGWSPNRSRMLGRSLVDALAYIHPYLREEGEFWKTLPTEDAYVLPTPKYKSLV
jgi:murein tripeptide amidase MpaA